MRIEIRQYHAGELLVRYIGSPEQLIASGAATDAILLPRRAGARRLDEDGDYYWRDKCPNGRFRIARFKPIERAAKLPGVTEWLTANPLAQREDLQDVAREFAHLERPADAWIN